MFRRLRASDEEVLCQKEEHCDVTMTLYETGWSGGVLMCCK